jgi:hypothetical protein
VLTVSAFLKRCDGKTVLWSRQASEALDEAILRALKRGTVMNILEFVAIEIPCSACGGRYKVTLKQILLSQEMLHQGYPVQVDTECPPLAYSGLVDQKLVQELQDVWMRIEEKALGADGELKLRCD